MTARLAAIAVLVLLVLPGAPGAAQDLIPIPDFTKYEVPPSETPQTSPRPESPASELLDLAVFCGLLVAATVAALKFRRRWALLAIAVVALLWLGFWREGCICAIGATQNVALALGDSGYAIPWTVVVLFTLPLLFTLFFGRTFCAAVCPLGAVQELVAVRPVRVPEWLEHSLGVLPWVYLGLAVLFAVTGTAFVICRYDPFVGFFRLSATVNMLVFGGSLLLLGVFVGRPYCRYLCPYGAILGLCSRVARRHVTITPDECIQCRLCEDVCPYGAIQPPTVAQTPEERARGRWRLGVLLVALPLLVLAGFGLGRLLGPTLSRLDPTVRLADRVLLEETGGVKDTTDASDAFRRTGRPAADLYREAQGRVKMFGTAGAWFGAWIGLVIGVRLIYLSVRRRRSDYEPVRANCVSCGRCFRSCPREMLRLGLIADVAEVVPQAGQEMIPASGAVDRREREKRPLWRKKLQVREVLDTKASVHDVVRLLEGAFELTKVLGGQVENRGDVLLVTQICGGAAGTSFWIYRDDHTRITARRENGGVACLAEVDYRPSKAWYSAVFLTGTISVFGWIQPVVLYHLQKRAVRKYIEDAFAEVRSKLSAER